MTAKFFIEPLEWDGTNGKIGNYFFSYNVEGVPHIGVGHKIQPGESFMNGISLNEVYNIFNADLLIAENKVRERLGDVYDNLNENQRAALISFVYNTGKGNSELFNYVISGNDLQLKDWWLTHWLTPNLLSRRKAEVDLYFSPSGIGSMVLVFF